MEPRVHILALLLEARHTTIRHKCELLSNIICITASEMKPDCGVVGVDLICCFVYLI